MFPGVYTRIHKWVRVCVCGSCSCGVLVDARSHHMSRLGIEFMSSCASCQLCGSVYHMHVNSFPNAKIYHSSQFLCMCMCVCVRVYSRALVFLETWQEVWHRKRIMITNKNESAKLSNSSLSVNRFTYLRSVYVCAGIYVYVSIKSCKSRTWFCSGFPWAICKISQANNTQNQIN